MLKDNVQQLFLLGKTFSHYVKEIFFFISIRNERTKGVFIFANLALTFLTFQTHYYPHAPLR